MIKSFNPLALSMAARIILMIAFFSGNTNFAQMNLHRDKWSLVDVFKVLDSTPTGRQVVAEAKEKALSMNKNLSALVVIHRSISAVSSEFFFKYNQDDPQETITEHFLQIFLNKQLNLQSAALALAHELTHFIGKDFISFYDLTSTMGPIERIVLDIEGKGGEVDAFLVECKLLKELTSELNYDPYCYRVMDQNGRIHRRKAVSMFYRVGDYMDNFVKELQQEDSTLDIASALPHLSNGRLFFLDSSSSGRFPYPVSIYRKYHRVKKIVCQVHLERLQIMNPSSQGRALLSSQFNDYCVGGRDFFGER